MKLTEWRDVDKDGRTIRLRRRYRRTRRAASCRSVASCSISSPEPRETAGEPIGDFRRSWHNACVAAGLGKFEKIIDEETRKKTKVYSGLLVHDFRRSAVKNLIKAEVSEKVAVGISKRDRFSIGITSSQRMT